MILKPGKKNLPKEYDRRIVKKFSFLPKEVILDVIESNDTVRVWLETYLSYQSYQKVTNDGIQIFLAWEEDYVHYYEHDIDENKLQNIIMNKLYGRL